MDERLDELIDQWDQARRQGRDISAADLCRDNPDLLERVRKRMKALKATEWLEQADEEEEPEQSTAHSSDGPQDHGLPATLGRYQLIELIGEGGFGQVWRGFDPELQRTVAVKVPKAGRVGSAEEFLQEARRVAQLRHPGIVPVFDAGVQGDFYFVVSQFIDGGNLAQRLATNRPSPREAAHLLAAVAKALHLAHLQHFIHRDIKPANILLDSGGQPFLADFGIAASDTELRVAGTATVGTLSYMSPEQVVSTGQPLDARSDIYSLGVVLYELLTGRLPHAAPDPIDLRQAILTAQPSPPRALDSRVPPDLERVCLTALAKDPRGRFPAAQDFAVALQKAVALRRRLFWPIEIGLMLLVAVAIVASVWFTREQRKAQEITDQSVRRGQAAVVELDHRLRDQSGIGLNDLRSHTAKPEPAASTGPAHWNFRDRSIDLTGRTLTDDDYRRLGRNFMLKQLILARTPTTDAQLDLLHLCVTLEELDLSGTRVSDQGLRPLGSLPALQRLNLADSAIGDDSLKALRFLHLRQLNLRGTKITDAGLKLLSDRDNVGRYLNVLDVSGTTISDKGADYLNHMTRLENLNLAGTNVTDEGVAALRIALPKCKINR